MTKSSGQLGVHCDRRSIKLGEEVRQSLNASGDWAIYVNKTTDTPLKYRIWVGIE
ncbi:MAG: hypothetical protein WBO10_05205 [Pyrinomonadaceae bacterium]